MASWTIIDVAREAGVSTSSVSNVLNGRHQRMRHETRLRIEAAIQRLNYHPSGVARHLKTGHVNLIGLVLPTVANPYFGELAVAIESVAAEKGFQILLCNTLRDKMKEARFAKDLTACGVRRLISASAIDDHAELELIARQGISCVVFDRPRQEDHPGQVDFVSFDNAGATALAVRRLAEQGHSRICYASAPIRTGTREARARGFLNEMTRLGLGPARIISSMPPGIPSQFGDGNLSNIGEAIALEVANLPDPPSAVIAMNDMLALGMLIGFRKAGIEVPTQISVVGLDGIFASTVVRPSLSTVQQPLQDMADAALRLLEERDANRALQSRISVFSPRFIARESILPYRAKLQG